MKEPRSDPMASTVSPDGATSPATAGGPDLLPPGERVGRYLIEARLGMGGMGVVYAARDPDLDRRVAIKLLRSGAVEAGARLLREGKALARLRHPNVVAVHDLGLHRGDVFIAMELVDGTTLRTWWEARRQGEVLAVLVDAGRGLAAAHAAGLIHRDFKPENVLVGRDGSVRVTDFGLARLDGADGEPDAALAATIVAGAVSAGLTRTGAVVGTPAYMAPEQHQGKAIDARTDQFAFCV
ncbi:MAG TPA: serine/threonine-protein kinase, partial [Kofleriaceae bacterium]|nr:serine/threonine-protein kinase [Kofleriaceae bacterium]